VAGPALLTGPAADGLSDRPKHGTVYWAVPCLDRVKKSCLVLGYWASGFWASIAQPEDGPAQDPKNVNGDVGAA
jgi:hypothetical protein